MKKLTTLLTVSALALVAAVTTSFAATTLTADQALASLIDGNKHFVKGDFDNLERNSSAKVRMAVAAGQSPYAIVLTCSDSRLSPELLFDKGLGEVFVIRVAGNIVAAHELGSIEYGAEHLKAPLIVVLGHERCGAVTATVNAYGTAVEGNIGSLVETITPAVTIAKHDHPAATGAELVELAAEENIKLTAKDIEASPVISKLVEEHLVKIVGAKYDLDTGLVTLLPLE